MLLVDWLDMLVKWVGNLDTEVGGSILDCVLEQDNISALLLSTLMTNEYMMGTPS